MITIFNAMLLTTLIFFSACSSAGNNNSNSAFYETRWVLRAFSDSKVFTPDSKEEPFVFFSKTGGKATGFGGCNDFSFIFNKQKQKLKFENIVATEKFCESFMELEKNYLNIFVNSDSYKIIDDQLYLYKDSKLLARFENQNEK
ncbi:MAG TPA: META domain-containing protein [Ignavibacteria bacterium]|nr:META domain-containing protein [Ignavibacteria bacterium]HQY52687.1 META domain-containing protein [Ignavibacteria bacterium]HRB00653.1 META domain-containing protein [Ignavibacteria bacterium]